MNDARDVVARIAPRSVLGCAVFTLLSGGFFVAYWLTYVHGQVNEALPSRRLPTGWLWATWASYLASRFLSRSPDHEVEPTLVMLAVDLASLSLALVGAALLVFLELRLRSVLNTALELSPGHPGRFALVPTVLLGILYLQWKLNRLAKLPVTRASGA